LAATGARANRWVEDACPEGQLCLQGACVPFSCAPGRAECDGLGRRGLCDPTGAALVNLEECPQGTTCRGGACVDLCAAAAANRSYIGCDYLLASLPNVVDSGQPERDGEDGPYGLVVSNPEPLLPVTLRVEALGGAPARVHGEVLVRKRAEADELLPGTPATTVRSVVLDKDRREVAQIDGDAVDIELPPGGVATLLLEIPRVPSGATRRWGGAQRLRASLPVVAYQFSPYCCNYTFTNDASLLLPTTALGTRYVALGAPEWQELPPGLAVIAAQDDTQVKVTAPEGQRLSLGLDLDATNGEVEAVLQAGEALYLDTPQREDLFSDLTGAQIEASAPVAVFSTHLCSFIPHSLAACDHLEEQLIPTDTWGTQYLLAPPSQRAPTRREATYWRVQAGEQEVTFTLGVAMRELELQAPFATGLRACRTLQVPNTQNRAFTLAARQDCVFGVRRGTSLSATAPVQIMGFLAGEEATGPFGAGTGDPSMFLLAPVEQFRDSYAFLTPETYAQDYVTLLLLRDAAGGVTLDGAPLDPLDPALVAEPVLGSRYMALHVPVGDGAHRVEATSPFGLLVYAYDRFVSYAYTGGLNLTKRPSPP
jgi:hypothetical protein